MKKITLLSYLVILSIAAQAQVHAIDENFNTKCAVSTAFPDDWSVYSPSALGIPPDGHWHCTPTKGKPTASGATTPGMMCTGLYNSVYNLDTAYLISPLLSFTSAEFPNGHVYIDFDTKKDNIQVSGRLAVIGTHDSLIAAGRDLDTTQPASLITPVFGDPDSTTWITHQGDLSSYIDGGPFYIAFRYVSDHAHGTAWYVDNVHITAFALGVNAVTRGVLPLTIVGVSTSNKVSLSYSSPAAGAYDIYIYDMVGRNVYTGKVSAQTGIGNYTISDLALRPGIYSVRMGNENTYGTTKLMIQ